MSVNPRQAVEVFLNRLALKDMDAALSVVAADVTVVAHAFDDENLSLRALLTDLVTAFPDILITVKHVVTTGNVVTVELKIEGTQAADYAGAINQEKHLDLDEAWRFEVNAGVITVIDAYWCQQQLYRRLAVKRFDQISIA